MLLATVNAGVDERGQVMDLVRIFDATVVNTFLDKVLPAALEARVQSGDLSPDVLAAFQAKSQAPPQS